MKAVLPVPRNRFAGVTRILRFNRHWYLTATVGGLVAVTGLLTLRAPGWLEALVGVALASAVGWGIASILASHWIYDRSILREWQWIKGALSLAPRSWAQIHCGVDDSSGCLGRLFPQAEGAVLDVFDASEMTEASIARARRLTEVAGAIRADFRALPLATESRDAIFLLLAAHELRRRSARTQLFREVRRALRRDGEVIVAEHLRAPANFCAFGPGAFHFFSRSNWLGTFAIAGLVVRREFCITPFIHVFVLRRDS